MTVSLARAGVGDADITIASTAKQTTLTIALLVIL